MNRFKVAVAQMNATPEVEKNLETIGRWVAEAANEKAALIVLPEGFGYLGPDDHPRRATLAESVPGQGPIFTRCAQLAAQHRIEILAGGFPEKSDVEGKSYNACLHFRSDGSVGAIYRKIHLFDVDLPDGTKLEESRHVKAGHQVVTADTSIGKVGLSVCYDLRFPELYRALVDQGAIALAVPSAFTLTTGKDHWHVLLRARAIESQCYVLAAAQTGRHYGSRVSYGHALIADPWGTVIAEHGEGEGIVTAWIDRDLVTRVRTSLPSLEHRRLPR